MLSYYRRMRRDSDGAESATRLLKQNNLRLHFEKCLANH
jgi:hypothetical protein